MKNKLVFLSLIFFFSCLNGSSQTINEQTMEAMVNRLLPTHKDQFVFHQVESKGSDVYSLSSNGNKIVITGNNANAMATGLNYYLNYFCNTTVSWYAHDKIKLPDSLPKIQGKVTNRALFKNRFFLNYCTFGYAMTWWNWKDWEHFIDWMALNGINMPLAMTGQEAIWYRVWSKMGINKQAIRNYFTGPAHLAWHRMSNLDYWQGNLPEEWLNRQENLQEKILKRERLFNMRPILPAFSGHVPSELHTLFPAAKITENSAWGGFPKKYRSHFLDPLDPLFNKIQQSYIEEQEKSFGTDHLYGIDPFNEITPPKWDPDFLTSCSKNIYQSLITCDSLATWVQMTWLFYSDRKEWTNERIEAYLSGVPKDHMLLLDYFCEKKEVWRETKSFFGYPFIWCYLGNFGGNIMLAGNPKEVKERFTATKNEAGSNLSGIGSTLEGLGANSFMYASVFEQAWSATLQHTVWVNKLADRRLGFENIQYRKAWQLLCDSIYIAPAALGQGTLTNARPSLKGHGNWTTKPNYTYNNHSLYRVWKLMLDAATEEVTDSYRYDLVNIGRQYLGNTFLSMRDDFTQAYYKKDLSLLKQKGKEMITLLNDLDELLSTHSSFLLGKWTQEARSCSSNPVVQDYYELNAKTIISTWGEQSKSLNDYANRSWAGLTKSYYLPRWELFIHTVIASVKNDRAFNAAAFKEKVTSFEFEWTQSKKTYRAVPTGSSVVVTRKLISKYGCL